MLPFGGISGSMLGGKPPMLPAVGGWVAGGVACAGWVGGGVAQ